MKTSGLTIKEAIESGRPFRHKDSNVWEFFKEYDRKLDLPLKGYSPNQLISCDWEIKAKDTFTREDVERAIEAYRRVAVKTYKAYFNTHHAHQVAMAAAEQEQQ